MTCNPKLDSGVGWPDVRFPVLNDVRARGYRSERYCVQGSRSGLGGRLIRT